MSDKQKARLERWYVSTHPQENILYGQVYGHPRFRDGHHIHTSQIVKLDVAAGTCETLNTHYTLGEEAK